MLDVLYNLLPNFVINNVEFFVFILLLSIFLYVKRQNLVLLGSFPLLYMLQYKTTWGINLMKSWSKKHPSFWKWVAYVSVVIGIVGTVLMVPFLIWQLFFIVDQGFDSGGGLVLPINTGDARAGDISGVIFYVPFWYWLIAILFIATVHEFGHGVIAERFKVKIKSSGFAFLGLIAPIIPAAFVEPDMEDLAKKKRWQQIAVLGAGPLANIFFAIIFLIMILGVGMYSNNVYEDRGVAFSEISNTSALYGLVPFDNATITQLNVENISITDPQQIFSYFMLNLSNQTPLTLSISNFELDEEINVTFTPIYNQEEDRAMIGIFGVRRDVVALEGYERTARVVEVSSEWLFWLFLLNFGIGIMNLLPLWITDGGQILRVMLNKYMDEKRAMFGVHVVSLISLVLIVVTINPSLLPFVG
ncbi:MAG: site-2 protease family protein [Nanoarchaeota archaeon]|nr:site-2 protease family protein [Nanoarchaeota archaeon]